MYSRAKSQSGVALLLTLSMLVLITILVIGLSSMLITERSTAAVNLDHQRAEVVAEMARDHAIALIRDGITTAEKTYNSTDPAARKFWASEPGKITVFKGDGEVDSRWNLSSGSDPNAPSIDLNQSTFGGNNPIASANSVEGTVAPSMPINWVNVLQDPTTTATANNQLVGRYAFWVDDESSKINVNTADGTSKYVSPDYLAQPSSAPVSFGNGMPTEISIQGLLASATSLTATQASSIASLTGIRPGASITRAFNNPLEIQQAAIPATTYHDNNFSLTSYSRSPELNIFGEPKIYLLTTGVSASFPKTTLNIRVGAYPPSGVNFNSESGLPLMQVYPSSNPLVAQPYSFNLLTDYSGVGNQLPNFQVNAAIPSRPIPPGYPSPLPQYLYQDNTWYTNRPSDLAFPFNDTNYNLGLRISQYLKGYNSQGNPITWPSFPGSTATGFGGTTASKPTGKYTDRQLDSITLQILDMVGKDAYPDAQGTSWAVPSWMAKGFLSKLPVMGIGRTPRLTEVLMTFTVIEGTPYKLNITIDTEWYLPKEYKGTPAQLINGWGCFPGVHSGIAFCNPQDSPALDGSGNITGPAPIIGSSPQANQFPYWACNMLKVTDQNGAPAGVDLFGQDPDKSDLDSANSATYHPEAGGKGTGPIPGQCFPALALGSIIDYNNPSPTWNPGDYHSCRLDSHDVNGSNLSETVAYSLRSVNPPTQLNISGGIVIWSDCSGQNAFGAFPLDSMRGPTYTGENPLDPFVNAAIMAAVIPVGNIVINIPPFIPNQPASTAPSVQVLMKVADPLVDNFPGDWTIIQNPQPSDMGIIPAPYPVGYNAYQNGGNPEFKASGGGDPNSYWLPEINQNIPKSQRFPSVGYLQYIRTGIMPDPANDPNDPRYVTGNSVKGTPFRLLSLAPSYDPTQLPSIVPDPGQTTAGGGSYPDWAMLDLFTVPVSPQPLGGTGATPPALEMTYGGSTPGRININNPTLLAPFSIGSNVSRQIPMHAVLKNLQAYNSYDFNTAYPTGVTENAASTASAPSPVDEKALSTDISSYVAGLGRPFMMPSEVANVPKIANYLYIPNNLPSGAQQYQSRNDLVRQVLGNLTTQSNTFSVWAVGQALKKRPGNTSYGNYENGDIVSSEARTHYIVERYIDLGIDGVPGNASHASGASGSDGIVGTPDDLIDGDDTVSPAKAGANPLMSYPLPYKYRIVATEEIAN